MDRDDLHRRRRVARRPTAAELRHRRRRAKALLAVALAALLVGLVAGAGAGDDGSGEAGLAEQAKVGWFGHLRTLAGAGERSLDFEQRAEESRAIDRVRAMTPFVRSGGGGGEKLVALTFDDGPSAITDQLLDELQRLRVPSTFFVVTAQLPEHAATLQRMVDLGVVVADHTTTHANLEHLSREDQAAQIDGAAEVLESYGVPYPRLFRPPYGAYNATTHELLTRRRMLSVLWSVDSVDYTRPGADAIVRTVVDNIHPGAIVLLHDGGGERSQTLEAVPRIVKELRSQGYRFVTVPRLLLDDPPTSAQRPPEELTGTGGG